MIEFASALKLLLYISLILAVFLPQGLTPVGAGIEAYLLGGLAFAAKLALGGAILAAVEVVVAKMRVFRVSDFLGAALMLGLLATLLLFVSQGS